MAWRHNPWLDPHAAATGGWGEMARMCYSARITAASLATAMAILDMTGY